VEPASSARRGPGRLRAVPPEEELRCDLLCMGNRLPDQEERFWAFFAEAARRAPEKRVL